MPDPSDLLSTPANYATSAQLSAMRDYATALQKQSMGGDTRHWLQGVSHIVEALMGGQLGRQADVQEQRARAAAGSAALPSFGDASPPTPEPPERAVVRVPRPPGARPAADAPPSGGALPYAGGEDLDRYGEAIAKLESGGDYGALGPVTKSGDRAHGKYQVMGANVPGWTEEATGRRMTPAEFLADPAAQDATFRHRFGSYLERYGNPQDAASAWFTGGPRATGAGRADQLGTTGAAYVDKFDRALAAGGGAPPPSAAMAFSGEPADPSPPPSGAGAGAPALPPAATATVRALASPASATPGGPPSGPPAATSGASPAMPGGLSITGTFVPPEAFPRRPMYTPEQVRAVLTNPFATPAQQQMVLQGWAAQHQPLSMPWKNAGTLYANPANPAQQWFVPEIKTFKEKTGEIERDVPYVYDIRADRWTPVPMGANSGTVPAAPVGAGGAALASPSATPTMSPSAAPPSGGAAPGRAPFTGNAPGPLMEDLTAVHAERARREAQSKEDVKQYGNLHTGLAGAGLTASDQLPYIQIAKGIIQDPGFYSGTGSDAIMLLRRAGVGLGVLPATAATPMEAFNKVMAANILQQVNSLRAQQESMGSQSGRIFQSQIELMEKAAQNPANTVAANRYLTALAEWSANRSRKIADMADDYKIKHGALDANFEKGLRSALSADPDLRLPRDLQFPEAPAAAPPGALGTPPPPVTAAGGDERAALEAEMRRRGLLR